jgi:hypothetical protein
MLFRRVSRVMVGYVFSTVRRTVVERCTVINSLYD